MAGQILVNHGADMVLDAMTNAINQGPYNIAKGYSGIAVVEIGGGHSKTSTGSHVKNDSFNLLAGPGVKIDTEEGRTSIAVAFEAGWGSFDADHSFSNRAHLSGVSADGDTRYYGGALMLRHDMNNGFYGEAALRGGSIKTEYDQSSLLSSFDSSTGYIGLQGGIGYMFDAWQDGKVDVYGKVQWTHMGSDSFTTNIGERVRFDSSDSIRSRLGVRLSHNFMPNLKGYIGGAWEYEFDGEQSGNVDGVRIPDIDTKGHTGIGEIGVSYMPTSDITLGLAAHGSVGTRDSVGGTARFSWSW